MNAVASPRTPAPREPAVSVEITVPRLARLLGLSRHTMARRLREKEVVTYQRGRGTKRRHVAVMLPELLAQAPELVEALEWSALLREAKRPVDPEDDDE